MVESKLWYIKDNLANYPLVDGIVHIQAHNIDQHQQLVEQTIEAFNLSVVWTEMWDLEDANSRVEEGHSLFIGTDQKGSLAHVWFAEDYLYNCFVNPRRPDDYGQKFILACLNEVKHPVINLYTDEWNVRAQRFFEKVGFLQK